MSRDGFPIDLVLVRHGESEGNLAQQLSKQGDDSLWTDDFQRRHTSRYRLTELGVEQAESAGAWIKSNIGQSFDRYYCSEYVRAMETASILNFENAQWLLEFFLREQDRGVLGSTSHMKREKNYKQLMEKKKYDAFYWTPPGGESVATACLRVEKFLTTLRSSCSGFRVLVVCHGNIMVGFRVRLERMSQVLYEDWQKGKSPKQKFHNCQILHYSRRNPETGRVGTSINWVRSICPWDTNLSSNEWRSINRPVFNNSDLYDMVSRVKPIVTHKKFRKIMKAKKRAQRDGHDSREAKRPRKEKDHHGHSGKRTQCERFQDTDGQDAHPPDPNLAKPEGEQAGGHYSPPQVRSRPLVDSDSDFLYSDDDDDDDDEVSPATTTTEVDTTEGEAVDEDNILFDLGEEGKRAVKTLRRQAVERKRSLRSVTPLPTPEDVS